MSVQESARLWVQRLRWRLRRVPPTLRVGIGIAVVAVAGLLWQHNAAAPDPTGNIAASAPASPQQPTPDLGQESQPDIDEPDWTPEAARVVAERFAANFANPDGGHEQWLARLRPDIDPGLADQYQLTDIRNVATATVTSVEGPIGDSPGTAIFHATYSDGTRTQIELAMDGSGWTVAVVVPLTGPDQAPSPAPTPGAGQ